MLTSGEWIPLEGIYEAPLIHALVVKRRRFAKPLRYDARSAAAFPNSLLLDTGPVPVPLRVLSAFHTPAERATKDRAIAKAGGTAWAWRNDQVMPDFPEAKPLRVTTFSGA